MVCSSANLDEVGKAGRDECVAAHPRQAILGGHIRPGERIRQEEIAERLGASR